MDNRRALFHPATESSRIPAPDLCGIGRSLGPRLLATLQKRARLVFAKCVPRAAFSRTSSSTIGVPANARRHRWGTPGGQRHASTNRARVPTGALPRRRAADLARNAPVPATHLCSSGDSGARAADERRPPWREQRQSIARAVRERRKSGARRDPASCSWLSLAQQKAARRMGLGQSALRADFRAPH